MSNKGRSVRANKARNAKQSALKRGATIAELIYYDEIYDRDQGICQICWKPVAFKKGTMDHKHPLSKGGQHVKSNVQLAHLSCNNDKGSRVNEFSIRRRERREASSSVRSNG